LNNLILSVVCKLAGGTPRQIKDCVNFLRHGFNYNGPDEIDPPGWDELTGAGQTVGIIAFDTFQKSDVADYLALIGRPATQINNVSEVKVNGGASPGPNQDEVLLDVDADLTLAPGAKVVVYSGPFSGPGTSFQALFNAAISGGSTIISNSWAYCEDQTTLADVQSIDEIFKSAAAAGISILNAAGDTGSTCLNGSANTIAVPANSPNATAVGGSSLTSVKAIPMEAKNGGEALVMFPRPAKAASV
jgi:kumamolisin